MRHMCTTDKSYSKDTIEENWEMYSRLYVRELMKEHNIPVSIDEMVRESKLELFEAYGGLE